ncbi:MAG: EamA family transporter [Spirochaetales bacterium]|nr:EamA family transporter [Spirochaetales bacterium]
MDGNEKKGNFQAIISIILWCLSGVCFRKGSEVFKPMTYLALITGIGVLTAVLIQYLRKKNLKSLFFLPMKVIIAGIPGISIYTVFLAFAGDFYLSRPQCLLPHILALTGGFFWAVYSVMLKVREIPDEQSGTAFHFTFCSVLSLIIALILGEFSEIPTLTGESLFWIILGGVGPVGIAYYLWELGLIPGALMIAAGAYAVRMAVAGVEKPESC